MYVYVHFILKQMRPPRLATGLGSFQGRPRVWCAGRWHASHRRAVGVLRRAGAKRSPPDVVQCGVKGAVTSRERWSGGYAFADFDQARHATSDLRPFSSPLLRARVGGPFGQCRAARAAKIRPDPLVRPASPSSDGGGPPQDHLRRPFCLRPRSISRRRARSDSERQTA